MCRQEKEENQEPQSLPDSFTVKTSRGAQVGFPYRNGTIRVSELHNLVPRCFIVGREQKEVPELHVWAAHR
jgi:hypothetical protein